MSNSSDSSHQDRLFCTDGYSDTPIPEIPALAALFEKLSQGDHPDFLAVMAAISEMVAFYTDSDQKVVDSDIEKFLMSQKKCRFCY